VRFLVLASGFAAAGQKTKAVSRKDLRQWYTENVNKFLHFYVDGSLI
jgi:hypothetical protein